MADEEEGSEKPFEATPRKIEEARKRGEVPISQDLITFSVYLGVLTTAIFLGLHSVNQIGAGLIIFLDSPEVFTDAVFGVGGRHGYGRIFWSLFASVFLWFALPTAFALLTAFAQGALVFASTKLKPKLSRISPVSNAKQKYGRDGIFNFFKSFLKLVVYSVVLGVVFQSHLDEILSMPSLPVASNLTLTAELCFDFLVAAAIAILVFAATDLAWQRAQFFRKQRMSLQELRDENKETEGDPHTKQARRQKAYDIATNQMLQDVPDADVVVVNPEHYAVALKWVRSRGTAPVCVAKGVDEVAARIRKTANESGVPIYRDPPTARALHASVEIGSEISTDHYQAIAAAIRFADAIREKARKGNF
jgi:flagellar biosynthetic protein FlhB